MADTPLRDLPFAQLLASIGAKTPSPGGGAVASATGSLAAALGNMVVAFSVSKKSLAEHKPALERAAIMLHRVGEMLLELAEEDAAAYALLNALQRLLETDERRIREMPGAIDASINVPAAILATAADLLRLLEQLRPITNEHLRSDLAIAAILADAAARAGWWNVRINLPLLTDAAKRARIERDLQAMLAEASQRCQAIERSCG